MSFSDVSSANELITQFNFDYSNNEFTSDQNNDIVNQNGYYTYETELNETDLNALITARIPDEERVSSSEEREQIELATLINAQISDEERMSADQRERERELEFVSSLPDLTNVQLIDQSIVQTHTQLTYMEQSTVQELQIHELPIQSEEVVSDSNTIQELNNPEMQTNESNGGIKRRTDNGKYEKKQKILKKEQIIIFSLFFSLDETMVDFDDERYLQEPRAKLKRFTVDDDHKLLVSAVAEYPKSDGINHESPVINSASKSIKEANSRLCSSKIENVKHNIYKKKSTTLQISSLNFKPKQRGYKSITEIFHRVHQNKSDFKSDCVLRTKSDLDFEKYCSKVQSENLHKINCKDHFISSYKFKLGYVPDRFSKAVTYMITKIYQTYESAKEKKKKNPLTCKGGRSIENDLVNTNTIFSLHEIEGFAFCYWRLYSTDLINYNQSSVNNKSILKILISTLKVNDNADDKHKQRNVLNLLISSSDITHSSSITIEVLLVIKVNFSTILKMCVEKDKELWLRFMNRLNIHHYLCPHTINCVIKMHHEFLQHLDSLIDYQYTLNIGEHTAVQLDDITILSDAKNKWLIKPADISNLLHKYINKSKNVNDILIKTINTAVARASFAISVYIIKNYMNRYKFDEISFRGFANNYPAIYERSLRGEKNFLTSFKQPIFRKSWSYVESETYRLCVEHQLSSINLTFARGEDRVFDMFCNYIMNVLESATATYFTSILENEELFDATELASAIDDFMDEIFVNVHLEHDDGELIYDCDSKVDDFIDDEREFVATYDVEDTSDEEDDSIDEDELNDLMRDSAIPLDIDNLSKAKPIIVKSTDEKDQQPDKRNLHGRFAHGATNNYDGLRHYTFITPESNSRFTCSLCNINKNVKQICEFKTKIHIKACSSCLTLISKAPNHSHIEGAIVERLLPVKSKKSKVKKYLKAPLAFDKNNVFIEDDQLDCQRLSSINLNVYGVTYGKRKQKKSAEIILSD